MSDVGIGKVVEQGDVAGRLHRRSWPRDGLDRRVRACGRVPRGHGGHGRHAHRPGHVRGRQAYGRPGHHLRRGSSSSSPTPPDEPDPTVTFLTCGLEEAVATARSAAGEKNLEILGADVAAQCLQRGLVDEILVYVLPVLLGDGVRFAPKPRQDRPGTFSNTQSGAVTMLRFRVRK